MAPNNSFKPNLLRYGKSVAEKACHAFVSTTQVGLTQALGRRRDRMGEQKVLSGRKLILLSSISLSAGIMGTLIGRLLGAVLQTTPAWVGPAIFIGSITLVVVGVLLLPTAIREYRAAKREPAA